MIILWFILGILIILGIAKYNESNKLFWQLLLSFMLGFAITKMIQQVSNEKQSNEALVQVYPTQMSNVCMWTMTAHNTNMEKVSVVTAHPSVSQEYTPVLHESDITMEMICGRTRDQPQKILTNPPELCLQKDFSTHHEYG